MINFANPRQLALDTITRITPNRRARWSTGMWEHSVVMR